MFTSHVFALMYVTSVKDDWVNQPQSCHGFRGPQAQDGFVWPEDTNGEAGTVRARVPAAGNS